jgi:hypothetical protein
MTNLAEILSNLAQVRKQLDIIQKDRRANRLEFNKNIDSKAQSSSNTLDLSLSSDTAYFIQQLQYRLHLDVHRYTPNPPDFPPPIPVPYFPSLQELANELDTYLHPPSLPKIKEELTPAAKFFTGLLIEEIKKLNRSANKTSPEGEQSSENQDSANTATKTPSAAGQAILATKLNQVQQTLLASRLSDARTLLKKLQLNDPYNQVINFLVSQLEYLHVGMGQKGSLPEARNQAIHSFTSTDRISPNQINYYRYSAMVNELNHSPERALEWLRDSGMLKPELLQQEDGLTALGGQLLMAWVILSNIPANLWQDTEISAINQLVTEVSGGAFIYLALLREPLLRETSTRKTPIANVSSIETSLQIAWFIYQEQAKSANILKDVPQDPPWLIKVRYGQTLLSCLSFPSFDQILLNIALSGIQFLKTNPTHALQQQLEDRSVFYWRLWALTLATQNEKRQSHLIPFNEMQEDLKLAESVEKIMQQLRTYEQSFIHTETWDDLKPFMTQWSLDHLLAAGTGSNKPRIDFAPTLTPYNTLYARWSNPAVKGIMASEIILGSAAKGAFASWFEVLAAIEGGARLVGDPYHGLKQGQKNALAHARQQDPEKFAHIHLLDKNAINPLQMAGVAVFMAGGSWASLVYTANWGQAIGMLLAVCGVSGMLFVYLVNKMTSEE